MTAADCLIFNFYAIKIELNCKSYLIVNLLDYSLRKNFYCTTFIEMVNNNQSITGKKPQTEAKRKKNDYLSLKIDSEKR